MLQFKPPALSMRGVMLLSPANCAATHPTRKRHSVHEASQPVLKVAALASPLGPASSLPRFARIIQNSRNLASPSAIVTVEFRKKMAVTLPIYMDHNATTPVDDRVLAAMQPFFSNVFGNAASRGHAFGWEAEMAVYKAREQVAALLNAPGCHRLDERRNRIQQPGDQGGGRSQFGARGPSHYAGDRAQSCPGSVRLSPRAGI